MRGRDVHAGGPRFVARDGKPAVSEVLGRREARFGIARARRREPIVELARDGRIHERRPRKLAGVDEDGERPERLGLERKRTVHALVDDNPERPEIGPRVELLGRHHLLGAHVIGSSHHRARARSAREGVDAAPLRNPKVEKLHEYFGPAYVTLEGNFITPFVVGRSLTLNPVLVLLSLTFWGWMWGIVGILLAVPILATFKIFCSHIEPMEPLTEFMS